MSATRLSAFIAASFARTSTSTFLPSRSLHSLRRSFILPLLSRSTRVMPFQQGSAPLASAAQQVVTAPTAPVNEPKEKFLKDYTPPPFVIKDTNLVFKLDDEGLGTIVEARLIVERVGEKQDFVLDGEGLKLVEGSLKVNGKVLEKGEFEYDTVGHVLTIDQSVVPDGEFVLESSVVLKPAKNTELDGLYMSDGDYCTQCEAEAFRKITFYCDRPDVMAKFKVRIEADKKRFPVLLSNGNCVNKGEGEEGKHWVEYVDDFAKPSYLFALVAGDLDYLQDEFVTMGGRKVQLRVYVKGEKEVEKCEHAMRSLKKALKWDEEVYGREYHYDKFDIVAVSSFVFGAMENTTLNIFNSKYVLASEETATDRDFKGIEGVVAHECFHTHSGNRVTLNSWFQLSLKEGLTVFRDQSFSADMNSAAVKRIEDVTRLRTVQFAEDAGPMAHPVRPASYITCNSFYTATVYNKGAEVIRMLKQIVGPEGFRRGTDLYFTRNDGKAVACEDWIKAIQDANPEVDLTIFKRWYEQAGTPVVTVDVKYDETNSTMTLSCEQTIPPTDKQPTCLPAFIPIRMGLIGPDGAPVSVDLNDGAPQMTKVLNFVDAKTDFVLHNVPKGTVPSLLREFSAPVKLVRKGGISADELAFIMANDTDEFSRWDAGQQLVLGVILDAINSEGDFKDVPDNVIDAFKKTLTNEKIDAALRAEVFKLPAESYIAEEMEVADPVRIRTARQHVIKQIAQRLESELASIVKDGMANQGEYTLDPAAMGDRALKNVALTYLASSDKPETFALCLQIVRDGSNMTDVLAALMALASSDSNEKKIALDEFYQKWKSYNLVVDKWLAIQASASNDDVLDVVKALTEHEAYKETVPNSVYALLGGYGATNLHFPTDGSGYKFLADQVIRLNAINPQVAARIARNFTRWRKYDKVRQGQMEIELRRIKDTDGLSKDVFEVVNNCLSQADKS